MLAPGNAHVTEWRPLTALTPIAEAWRDLAARAAEPNVFYTPDFALAAAPVLGADAGAILVWAKTGRLLGLFPMRIENRRYGVKLPLLAGWTHAYGPLGTPLVDRALCPEVTAAAFDHIADHSDCPKVVRLPLLTEDGPVASAIADEVTRRGGAHVMFARHCRALFVPVDDEPKAYLNAALGRKKRKELDRQRRRLADDGDVSFDLATEPAEIDEGLREFLALEGRGWKGQAGTAATQNGDARQFVQTAVSALAARGQATIARLRSGNRTLAVGIVLRSGAGAWFWKIAYDETMAKSSPGVQLTLDLTKWLLRAPGLAWCDSCATADHPMIDHIWRERRHLCDLMIALRPGDLALARRLEHLRQGTLAAARRLRDLVGA